MRAVMVAGFARRRGAGHGRPGDVRAGDDRHDDDDDPLARRRVATVATMDVQISVEVVDVTIDLTAREATAEGYTTVGTRRWDRSYRGGPDDHAAISVSLGWEVGIRVSADHLPR